MEFELKFNAHVHGMAYAISNGTASSNTRSPYLRANESEFHVDCVLIPDHKMEEPAERPRFGRGLSRQYSLYPRTAPISTVKGAVTAAVDMIKFLYGNDFTR